ncbi:hypothetical protein CARUB_v10005768mg [Capsella rubella]|uniref:Cystatin domain-containing protein n=1 Tax=Capsella rubella TaxID=81985 RepID=R0GKR4_9BRAS|nr:uncharacterized protein LOC17879612 [Capsella rubella]EOA17449.1 hypothetical protein CARUB_v10005768mg [Capsella rubella]
MAGDGDSLRSDETAIEYPVQKKPKIEEAKATDDAEAKEEEKEEEEERVPSHLIPFNFRGKLIYDGLFLDEPECNRQRDLFYKQFEESEGFDVDWDSFDYTFNVINYDWDPDVDCKRTNKELIELLIHLAIKEHDEEYGTQLKFVEYVSALLIPCKGYNFHITFLAIDLNSSIQEPKSYQAKVYKFREEIFVKMVRVKPTQS